MAKTYEEILDEMPNRVKECNAIEGSFIYTALAPFAMELALVYLQLEEDEKNGFADTADYERLKRLALDRGIIPNGATHAVGIGKFDVEIPVGSKFSINTYSFIISNDENVYKALETGVAEKKIRSIGISNYYTKEAFDKVMTYATTTPSVIQNENHIFYQNNGLRDYVAKYGVVIESYFPFGGRGNTSESFNNDVIVELSKKYNKTPAQIILRWNLQSNYIAIPGSSNETHIIENNNIYDFVLSDEDVKRITEINKNQRYANW